ncbi:MAG: hypothetical protein AAGF11_26060 [Myxococcota bacterium]
MKRLLPRLLVTGLVTLGCARTSPEAPAAPPTSGRSGSEDPTGPADTTDTTDSRHEPTRYVLLREDATLASGFDPTADTAQASAPRDAPPRYQVLWIMRLRATHGDWLEVETLDSSAADFRHCHIARSTLDDLRLRLMVRAADAASVLRREVQVPLPDGQRITLGPGLRVTPPTREGAPAIVHTKPALPLPIPAAAIGRDYAEPRHYDQHPVIATLDRHTLTILDGITLPDYLRWQVFDRRDAGDDAIVTLAHLCARYELRVPASALIEPQAFGFGTLGTEPPTGPRHRIAAEAPIYWANGELAGSTRREILRYDEPARKEVGRVCFEHQVSSRRKVVDPVLMLCFDAVDVEPVPRDSTPAARIHAVDEPITRSVHDG